MSAPRKVGAVGIKLMRTQELYGGDIRGVLEVARLCDRMGVDEVHVSDHVIMSAEGHRNRPGFPYPLDYAGWYEPFAMLNAVAAVTERVRLSAHIIVAPLRPAVLLAKQIATLDALSGGRVDIGFGVGWQREEFAAANMPFERRMSTMIEQVEACRALWAGAPASFHGETVSFDDMYSLPLPPQGERLPISFGVPASPRNFEHIARLGVGFCPSFHVGDELAANVVAARAAYAAAGRDPASLKVTTELTMQPPTDASGGVDWNAAFAEAQPLIDTGIDVLLTHVVPHCTTPDQLEPFIERLLEFRR